MSNPFTAAPSWAERMAALEHAAQRQIFFIGGAPRSGTTWLGSLLDAHPEISCEGEGLFWQNLATPLDTLYAERRRAITEKNQALFRSTGGYRLPAPGDADTLLGTAVLQALAQQLAAKPAARALGEKTPENVFLFPRLKSLFPHAKLIIIARDPRDTVASAWHVFQKQAGGADLPGFVAGVLPALEKGLRAAEILARKFPQDVSVVTYEALHARAAETLAPLFSMLGVPPVAAKAEPLHAQGRAGRPGTWPDTLPPGLAAAILARTEWSFARFGWQA